MLRILFDQNVPAPLRRYLNDHEIRTADEEGWGELSNGDLIRSAEAAGFHILLTCDQNVQYQQNLENRVISLIVLGANIWSLVQAKIADIRRCIEKAVPGSFEFLEILRLLKQRNLGS